MVADCARLKASVVAEDERDEGSRMLLNLGHTFAHALEAACGYKGVTHGQAVAVGLCLAARLAHLLGLARSGLVERISSLLATFGLPTSMSALGPNPSPESVEEHMVSDKKRRLGRLRFVLPAAIGDVRIVEDVPADMVKRALKSA
jgi:3-dehydroquinate synthetase